MSKGKNRHHDKESSEISDRHDKIKEQNRIEREQKEKERIEKYAKPFEQKSDSHELQMKLHNLVFDTPKSNQNSKEWLTQYRDLMILCKKLNLWDGFAHKYQLNRRGYEI